MKIIINNIATEYEDVGQGPLILMLHGWGNDLRSFDEMTNRLVSNYRIVRLDLPGFGQTETPRAWNLDNYVNFVQSFVQKLNLQPEILLGHSFGGRIIIKAVAQGKFDVQKIVLISPAGVSVFSGRRKFFKILGKIGSGLISIPPFIFWRKKIKNVFYNAIGSDYHSTGHLKEIFASVTGEDLAPFARAIKSKTLLVWGRQDQVTPLRDGELLHALIKDSKLQIIEDAGHFAHIEKPSEVEKVIMDFIK